MFKKLDQKSSVNYQNKNKRITTATVPFQADDKI
jgi:hypothetical protein